MKIFCEERKNGNLSVKLSVLLIGKTITRREQDEESTKNTVRRAGSAAAGGLRQRCGRGVRHRGDQLSRPDAETEERVDTEELVRFSSETAEVILPAGRTLCTRR